MPFDFEENEPAPNPERSWSHQHIRFEEARALFALLKKYTSFEDFMVILKSSRDHFIPSPSDRALIDEMKKHSLMQSMEYKVNEADRLERQQLRDLYDRYSEIEALPLSNVDKRQRFEDPSILGPYEPDRNNLNEADIHFQSEMAVLKYRIAFAFEGLDQSIRDGRIPENIVANWPIKGAGFMSKKASITALTDGVIGLLQQERILKDSGKDVYS